MTTILSLCHDLKETAFAAGQVLLAEGTRTGFLYVLIDGEVEILKGSFQVDIVSNAGAIFGEVSALLGTPHMATVRTVSASRVYRIEEGPEFLRSHPSIALEVARLLAHRLNGVTNYLVDLKGQFQDQSSHLGMVDEVLETLVHQQERPFIAGSERDPDTSI